MRQRTDATVKDLPGAGGLKVPDDLDGESVEIVRALAAVYSGTMTAPWRSFGAAWNGLPYRFRAAHEFNNEFVKNMKAGDGPPPEERYLQERALFGFASAALSTLECFAFAAYCVGSLANPSAFPVTTERDLRFYPADVRDAYLKAYREERVTALMVRLLEAPEYRRLSDLRNVLSHRGALPRSFHMSVGSGPHVKTGAYIPSNPKSMSSDWTFDQTVDAAVTQSLRDWLGTALSDLLKAMAEFAQVRLSITKPLSNER